MQGVGGGAGGAGGDGDGEEEEKSLIWPVAKDVGGRTRKTLL